MKNKKDELLMTNHRERHSLLEQNIRLKKEQDETNRAIDGVLNKIHEKMDKMSKAIDILSKKESTKETVIVKEISTNDTIKEVKQQEKDQSRIFIPSPDTSGLKSSVTGIQKKKRETNLADAASKLADLQKKQ